MAAKVENLVIERGKTFSKRVHWATSPIVYKPITAISKTAPVSITCPLHEVPPDWPVAIVSVKGMTEINAQNTPPKTKDYHPATVVNANTIELNDVNASNFKTYTSGGYVQYDTPVDLTGFSARMSIKDKVGGTELLRLESATNKILIDHVNSVITLVLSATETAAIGWTKGVYELELVSPGGVVTALLTGSVSVTKEVTT